MSDTNTSASGDDLDKIEEAEDKREEAQFDKEVESDGLLPAPDATPTDGPAPGA